MDIKIEFSNHTRISLVFSNYMGINHGFLPQQEILQQIPITMWESTLNFRPYLGKDQPSL